MCDTMQRGKLCAGYEKKRELRWSGVHFMKLQTGIITYFLHGSSRDLIRAMVSRMRNGRREEAEKENDGDGK